jgi:hypothetical protein
VPLALALAVYVARLIHRLPALARTARTAGRAPSWLIVVLAVALAGVFFVALRDRVPGTSERVRDRSQAWAATLPCVWGVPQRLVIAGATTGNASHGCDVMVDLVAEAIVRSDAGAPVALSSADVYLGNPAWRDVAWQQITEADGVILESGWLAPGRGEAPSGSGGSTARWLADSGREAEFLRLFEKDFSLGTRTYWSRR